MNEITKQIIEVGKLIGKKVFIKHYVSGSYYNDTESSFTFTTDDFEFYAYNILNGKYELLSVKYRASFGRYYLVSFKDN